MAPGPAPHGARDGAGLWSGSASCRVPQGVRLSKADDPWGDVLGQLLHEVLHAAWFPKHVDSLVGTYRPAGTFQSIAYPPELLTLIAMNEKVKSQPPGSIVFVYPAPPWGPKNVRCCMIWRRTCQF